MLGTLNKIINLYCPRSAYLSGWPKNTIGSSLKVSYHSNSSRLGHKVTLNPLFSLASSLTRYFGGLPEPFLSTGTKPHGNPLLPTATGTRFYIPQAYYVIISLVSKCMFEENPYFLRKLVGERIFVIVEKNSHGQTALKLLCLCYQILIFWVLGDKDLSSATGNQNVSPE